MDDSPSPSLPAETKWKPLSAKQRRVLGTLMEKSKTTPDAYPMSYSGLMTGCNQKSNRAPITNYTADQIEAIVDELRESGAVTIVQGSGRVTKVRHYAYQWLGIGKVEGAIMTELLLRGEQTIGELRTRASRMEPIADLDELKRILDELKGRDLVVELSPAGRGQVVSHNLYPEWELEAVRKHVAAGVATASLDESSDALAPTSSGASLPSAKMEQELLSLRETVQSLLDRVSKIESELGLVE
jgi:uncharacterized protein YceH (UPF0502 family)